MLAYDVTHRFEWLEERNTLQADPRLTARWGFHTSALSNMPAGVRNIIHLLAATGDRLAVRLVAQELTVEGNAARAVPLLHMCMIRRPANSPPVEELLL